MIGTIMHLPIFSSPILHPSIHTPLLLRVRAHIVPSRYHSAEWVSFTIKMSLPKSLDSGQVINEPSVGLSRC